MKNNNIVLLLGALGFIVMADNWGRVAHIACHFKQHRRARRTRGASDRRLHDSFRYFPDNLRTPCRSLRQKADHYIFHCSVYNRHRAVRRRFRTDRPGDLSGVDRNFCGFGHAYLPGADRRYFPGSGKTRRHRHLYGDIVPGTGTQHDHGRRHCVFSELAGCFCRVCSPVADSHDPDHQKPQIPARHQTCGQ